ncbi:unnamed protein product [Prorocentrum cordatum]|uniref:Tyr recombinase domain-containing protein n=1 Tax=Prorocentrum cordatum TaxID=2364126 RepID=A0ABN9UJ71_9DINO|nr:unnamed protein product [Polarella glacialis]
MVALSFCSLPPASAGRLTGAGALLRVDTLGAPGPGAYNVPGSSSLWRALQRAGGAAAAAAAAAAASGAQGPSAAATGGPDGRGVEAPAPAAAVRCDAEHRGQGLAAPQGALDVGVDTRRVRSREQTLRRLAGEAGVPLLPATLDTVALLAGALKVGRYRTGPEYVSLWRHLHCKAGFAWGPELSAAAKEANRSLQRGIGPAKQAETVRFEEVLERAPLTEPVAIGGPIRPTDMVIVATAWMLRGAEAAAILGEQARASADSQVACIELGATKTNPEGRECTRSLMCSCAVPGQAGLAEKACPVHALLRILQERDRRGWDGKFPLFPSGGGTAPSREGVVATLRRVAGAARLSEHSLRRMGAQYYARRGVPMAHIEFLGRWGGPTVRKYVGDALGERVSEASRVAAAGGPGGRSDPGPSLSDLKSLLREVVAECGGTTVEAEVEKRCAAAFASWEGKLHAASEQAHEVWAKQWAAERKELVGGVRSTEGEVHEVVVGDAVFPTDMWVARCGWRFGRSWHERCPVTGVSCKKCLASRQRAIGQVG